MAVGDVRQSGCPPTRILFFSYGDLDCWSIHGSEEICFGGGSHGN